MRYQRHRRASIGVPVISMGDIAFLLTIFFLVCSNFAKESGIRFTPPRSADIDEVSEASISVLVDTEGQVFLQGREIPVASLKDSLEAMLAGETDEENRRVMFKCDREIDRTVFEPVIAAIIGAGGIVVAVGDRDPAGTP